MNKVAVLDDYEGMAARLGSWASLRDCEVTIFQERVSGRPKLIELLSPFNIIVVMRERTPFPAELFDALPRLQLLVTTGARNRAIDLDAARRHNVLVCGTDGLPFPAAELTWGLTLALARNIHHLDAEIRAGNWPFDIGTSLNGKTLGLLGLGRIGKRVARVGQAFEMNVVAWSPNLTPERASESDAVLVSRKDLFRSADVLSVHLVLAKETRRLIGRNEFDLMKPSAFLINTSRGQIIDEQAMIEALTTGSIAGAGLDVFHDEPLPTQHPLRKMRNVVMTPHVGYVVHSAYELFFRQVVEDIDAFLSGGPVRVLLPG